MTGLRERKRDLDLPRRHGEGELCPLDETELPELVAEHLLRADGPRPVHASLEYARWKPGVSTTCAYRVDFEEGGCRIVAAKRYADGKDRLLAERDEPDSEHGGRLRLRAFVPERSLVLWPLAADRVLSGLRLLYERRALSRAVEEAGIVTPRTIRRRRIELCVLRYKPERRAVVRVGLPVRTDERVRVLAARVLAHPLMVRIGELRQRLAVAAPSLAPAAHVVGEQQRLLLEQWIDGEFFAPDRFDHASLSGDLLRRLHRAADVPHTSAAWYPPLASIAPLFDVDPELACSGRGLVFPDPPSDPSWVHGDFHPDQVAWDRASEELRLVDLDEIGAGDPLRDLASWIADHLIEGDVGPQDAAGPLLAGYGGDVDQARLWSLVSAELVLRAAASVRRLEEDAVSKAHFALDVARELR